MITCFTDPYPGELFYSILSRYHAQMGYRWTRYTMLDLYGRPIRSLGIGLPRGIEHLIQRLPPHAQYSAEELIDKHTSFPLYAPFLSPAQTVELTNYMSAGNDPQGLIKAGLSQAIGLEPPFLRFCPVCVEKDQREWGEPYWHRLHQAPGVVVCPMHEVYLVDSPVPASRRLVTEQFQTAAAVLRSGPRRPVQSRGDRDKILLQVARDVAWLHEQELLRCGPEGSRKRYLAILIEQALAKNETFFYRKRMLSEFRARYPEALLRRLGIQPELTRGWVHLDRVWQPAESRNRSPLLHLLLMHMLGYSAEQFFARSQQSEVYGPGPWPCLNPVCIHFRNPVIERVDLRFVSKHFKVQGRFECTCGFAYTRNGYGHQLENPWDWSSVKEYGHVWQDALRLMWADPSLPVDRIATSLGVSSRCVAHQSHRLGFLNCRETTYTPRQWQGRGGCHRKPRPERKRDIQLCRDRLLLAIKENPKARRGQLRRRDPNAYDTLLQKDPAWLERHVPPPEKRGTNPNWADRDNALACQVEAACVRLKGQSGRPVRMTRSLIERELGLTGAHEWCGKRLPRTLETWGRYAESWEEFALRRIHWTIQVFRDRGERPDKIAFRREAGLGMSPIMRRPTLAKAMLDGLEELCAVHR